MRFNVDLAVMTAILIVCSCSDIQVRCYNNTKTKSKNMQRIILDLDTGIDDAYALIHFLHAEKLKKVKIEAITCTRGNTAVNNVCKNIVRILETVGRTDIPVYQGAENSIIVPEQQTTPTHFGLDGFGDLEYEKEPNISVIKKEPAAVAMRNIVVSNPKEITLVCLAPLTNVALAIKLYKDFAENLGEIYIMGGNYRVIKNMETTAEFNFFTDPESAYIVLRHLRCPTTIFTYEAGMETSIDIDWRFNILAQVDSPIMNLMNKAEKKIHASQTVPDKIWYPFDGFLAVAVVSPDEIIKRKSNFQTTVELGGKLTRGQLVLEYLKDENKGVVIIESIDSEYYKKVILEAVKNV